MSITHDPPRTAARALPTCLAPWLFALAGACASPTPSTQPHAAAHGAPLITAEGVLRARTLDDRGVSRTEHYLETAPGVRTRLLLDAPPTWRPGTRLVVRGQRLDAGTLAVAAVERPPQVQVQKRLNAALQRIPARHSLAVLMMEDVSLDAQHVQGAVRELDAFFQETTRGVDSFEVQVVRRYRIAYSATSCEYDHTYELSDALLEAFEADGFRAADYDHIAVVIPSRCGPDWSGAWADVGGIRDDGSPAFQRLSMYKDNAFDPWYLAHELGHNLGMNHARSFDCGEARYRPHGRGCEVEEYGNFNDPMGWGEGVYWSAPHLRFMGWIAPEHVVTVGASDVFNLFAIDAEVPCGVQALRIPVEGEIGGYFYVEYRSARPSSPYAGTGPLGGARRDVVLVSHSTDGTGNSSRTERLELGGSRYEGAAPGERYELPNGVTVEVLATDGPRASVAVSVPSQGAHRDDRGAEPARDATGQVGPLCEAVSCPPEGCPRLGAAGADAAGPDLCPNDPTKRAPGQCGCGVAESALAREVAFRPLGKSAAPTLQRIRAAMAGRTYVDQAQAAQHAQRLAFEAIVELKRRYWSDAPAPARAATMKELKALRALTRAPAHAVLQRLGATLPTAPHLPGGLQP